MDLHKLGPTQQKVLLLLLAGVALSLTRSFRVQLRIMRELKQEWRAIDRNTLTRSVRSLHKTKLVHVTNSTHGTPELSLTSEGRRIARLYHVRALGIAAPRRWDGKWRIVIYDVPERRRALRKALLQTMKLLGFVEIQRSVFVYPFECENEISQIIQAYNAKQHVRYVLADKLDGEQSLRRRFKQQYPSTKF